MKWSVPRERARRIREDAITGQFTASQLAHIYKIKERLVRAYLAREFCKTKDNYGKIIIRDIQVSKLGGRVHLLRSLGMSAREIAKAVNKSPSYIFHLLSKTVDCPQVSVDIMLVEPITDIFSKTIKTGKYKLTTINNEKCTLQNADRVFIVMTFNLINKMEII